MKEINPPTIQVDLLYCIEDNEVSFDKELMISDFITEMNGVIAEFCKQNNQYIKFKPQASVRT